MVALAVLTSSIVRASEPSELPVTLLWAAPPGCPQRDEVWRLLSEQLGREPATPAGATFAARGVTARTEGGWVVELHTLNDAGPGHRALRGSSCEEVTRAAVVSLALAIDPQRQQVALPAHTQGWLGVGARSLLGVLPTASVGLQVSVTVDVSSTTLGASLSTAFPQFIAVGAGVTTLVPIAGGASACWGLRREGFSLLGCIGARGAAVSASAASGLSGTGVLLGVGPSVSFRYCLGPRLALRAEAEVSASLLRPSFSFIEQPAFHEVSVVNGGATLMLEVRGW